MWNSFCVPKYTGKHISSTWDIWLCRQQLLLQTETKIFNNKDKYFDEDSATIETGNEQELVVKKSNDPKQAIVKKTTNNSLTKSIKNATFQTAVTLKMLNIRWRNFSHIFVMGLSNFFFIGAAVSRNILCQ